MPNSDDPLTSSPSTAPRLEIGFGPDGVVTAVGEIDPHTTELLLDAIVSCSQSAGVESVAVDLSGITFIDSSGLRTLISAQQSLAERDVDLVVRSPSPQVSRLLDIVGLDEHIRVQP